MGLLQKLSCDNGEGFSGPYCVKCGSDEIRTSGSVGEEYVVCQGCGLIQNLTAEQLLKRLQERVPHESR